MPSGFALGFCFDGADSPFFAAPAFVPFFAFAVWRPSGIVHSQHRNPSWCQLL